MHDLSERAVQRLTVSEAEAGQKLLNYLKRRLGRDLPDALLHRIIRNGEARVNGKRATPFSCLAPGDEVRIPPLRINGRLSHSTSISKLEPLSGVLDIVAETPEYILIHKPAGLPVHPGSKHTDNLSSRLAAAYPDAPFTPTLAHRLDKNTSGLILAAKTYRALRAIQDALRARSMLKDYLAWAEGSWPENNTLPLHDLLEKQEYSGCEKVTVGTGKEALCLVRTVLRREGYSLLLIRLLTGRTHQIRVQLSSRGHPIAGDVKYGSHSAEQGMRLHAWRLVLPDGQIFTVPPPWRDRFALETQILDAIPITF